MELVADLGDFIQRYVRSGVDTGAVGALRALGLVAGRPLAGCPLAPRRCMSPPMAGSSSAQRTVFSGPVTIRKAGPGPGSPFGSGGPAGPFQP